MVTVSDVRERIRHHVEREPGVHFRAVVRDLDLAPGQVQYHLRRLRRAGELIREEYAGRTHFFPPEHDAQTRRQLAALRRETARDIVLELAEGDASRPAAVAEAVGIARSTLEWHLERLVAEGLVEKGVAADGGVELSLADPELVGRRLEAVEPAAPERLLDRYTRLVDALVSGD